MVSYLKTWLLFVTVKCALNGNILVARIMLCNCVYIFVNMAFGQTYFYASCFFKKKKKALITVSIGFTLMSCLIVTFSNGLIFSLFFSSGCIKNCDFFSEGNITSNGWKIETQQFYSSKFQNVTSTGNSVIFSAFLDNINSGTKIRAIGIKDRKINHDVYCLLWSETFKHKIDILYVISAGYIDPHPENFDRRYVY